MDPGVLGDASTVAVDDASAASERALARMARALEMLGTCMGVLVHSTDEASLVRGICREIVDVGGYRLAWVGFAEHDAEKTVRPVALAGPGADYVEHAAIRWDDGERGRGPTGTAIRTGRVVVARDTRVDPAFEPWRASAAAMGYRSSASIPLRAGETVFGALNVYAGVSDAFDAEELRLLTRLADNLAYGILALRERALRESAVERLHESLEATVGAIASTVELRDRYTAGHQQRVARLAVAIAYRMGLPREQGRGIYLAGLVHDVGKVNVPTDILSKPGRLTDVEFQLIRTHPEAGWEILRAVEFPWPIAETVRQHHERLDGSGYPRGLAGDAILVEARTLAVADVFEAITAHRPYRPALGQAMAVRDIERGRGTLYDAAAADACLALVRSGDANAILRAEPVPRAG